ncbi:hypothetical protein BH10PSE7_BH10PSE7_39210 [soil metagenome]
MLPRLLGIPVLYGSRLVEIRGRERVESVVVEGSDGVRTEIPCDGVVVTGRFVPASELVRGAALEVDVATGGPAIDQYGRLSDSAYFASGNVLRPIETAGWCYREGRSAGGVIADDLACRLPDAGKSTSILPGRNLKYVMPQRIAEGAHRLVHAVLQMRVREAVAGRLVAEVDEKSCGRGASISSLSAGSPCRLHHCEGS